MKAFITIVFLVLLLIATSAWGASLTLTWIDNSTNEDGFKIYRREAPSGSVFTQITSVGTDVVQHTDTTVTGGVIYCYQVKAFNSTEESGPSNEACAQVKVVVPKPLDEPVALGFKLDLECTMKRLADDSVEITCPAP